MNLGSFFFMLLSFTGAAVTVVWSIALAAAYAKRTAAKSTVPSQLSNEEFEAVRARLEELEHRELRVEEIEERLDFVERALGRSREAKPLRPGQ